MLEANMALHIYVNQTTTCNESLLSSYSVKLTYLLTNIYIHISPREVISHLSFAKGVETLGFDRLEDFPFFGV